MVQNRTLNYVYLIPIFLFIGLVADGVVTNIFSPYLLDNSVVFVPRIMLLLFVVFTLFFPKQPEGSHEYRKRDRPTFDPHRSRGVFIHPTANSGGLGHDQALRPAHRPHRAMLSLSRV